MLRHACGALGSELAYPIGVSNCWDLSPSSAHTVALLYPSSAAPPWNLTLGSLPILLLANKGRELGEKEERRKESGKGGWKERRRGGQREGKKKGG